VDEAWYALLETGNELEKEVGRHEMKAFQIRGNIRKLGMEYEMGK